MSGPKHGRKSIRLPSYDYSSAGAYFVTLCADGRESILGRVTAGKFDPSTFGRVAEEGWKWLEEKFALVKIPIFCVMPNHVHAILQLAEAGRGGLQTAPTQSGVAKPKSLGRLVGAYKTHTTVQINNLTIRPHTRFWQRNYFERVIRNQSEFEATYEYILNNPNNWENDKEFNASGP